MSRNRSHLPYQPVPIYPYAMGGHHFSNGPTWAEDLTDELDTPVSGKPALREPGVFTNYAVGRARARPAAPVFRQSAPEPWRVVRTREHANAFPYILIGCYWSGCYGGNKPTCHSTNNAHGPGFRFYETGFRCCRDAAGTK